MLYSGLVAGVAAGNLAAREAGINTLHAYIATLILIIPALAGARLLFVAMLHNGGVRNGPISPQKYTPERHKGSG